VAVPAGVLGNHRAAGNVVGGEQAGRVVPPAGHREFCLRCRIRRATEPGRLFAAWSSFR